MDAVSLAQTMLNALSSANLKVDGFWGSASREAYQKASATVKNTISARLGAEGDFLASSDPKWVTETELQALLQRVEAETNVPASRMYAFVQLEASRYKQGEAYVYNARSVAPSGLFYGLAQMGRPAWTDVVRAYPRTPSFVSGRFDPLQNLLAAARMAIINEGYLRKKGFRGEFTLEVMYAAHNQGAGGFMRLLGERKANRNFANQSGSAKQMIRAALRQSQVTLA